MTPQEAWSGYTPSVSHFRIFGCIAYAQVPNAIRKKLDDKGEKYIFIGYSKESKAYKLYNPLTKKVFISRDVVFVKEDTWKWTEEKDDKTITLGQEEEIQNQQTHDLNSPTSSPQDQLLCKKKAHPID
ncbi:hypothetical protein HPP92_010948 [Vanilla planifolia]|uniref:Retroviral polymerase SH3-like domain-containing protein n=1 Tax=Vanilla planifolia TaxID=51239 RepID=A0A835R641_VANPL|nr:hypothetical protein HPP92_010948 [Vanilla planifolia]